jgi:hypothetical protein
MIIPKSHVLPFALAATCLMTGCGSAQNGAPGSGDGPPADAGASSLTTLAVSADDGTEMETNVAAVAQSVVSSSATLAVANSGDGLYEPAGCLIANVDSASKSATYVFSGCTGPFGLASLSGTVDVVWSSSGPDNLQLTFSAQNFQVNNATLSTWNATAVVTASGGARDMTWTASLNGTTAGGRAFDRTNNKDLKWTVGQSCLTVAGTSDGTIAGMQLTTTFTNYERCEASCPSAGSVLDVKDVENGDSIDITYLGGASADFTGVNGGETTLSLACQP